MAVKKLSPKMEQVMEALKNARPYYMDSNKTEHRSIHDLHTTERVESCRGVANMLHDGSFIIHDHSNTLVALEKRGLVEIVKLGGNGFDIVRIPGFEKPETLTSALRLKVTRKYYSDYCHKDIVQELEEYATPDALELVEKRWRERAPKLDQEIVVEVLEVVPVHVWNYFED